MRRAIALLCAGILFLYPSLHAAAEDSSNSRFQSVVVRPGDTLWGIANAYLKDPTRWNVLLQYNKLPNSDPTVALPGMVLRVPVALIKEDMRAALLVFLANRVMTRRKDHADWNAATLNMQLYKDDGIQTMEDSSARVRFVGGDVLSMEPNSMAILRPRNRAKEKVDLQLMKGGVEASHAKTITVSASITPQTRDTRYTADIGDDLSTKVEVYSGRAEVEGSGMKIQVEAGYQTEVKVNDSPSIPSKIPDMAALASRIAQSGLLIRGADLKSAAALPGKSPSVPNRAAVSPRLSGDNARFTEDLKALNIGQPVTAYHIEASDTRDFNRLLLDKTYDADEEINLDAMGLRPGPYYWRVATVDLLGTEAPFGPVRTYRVGSGASIENLLDGSGGRGAASVVVTLPPEKGDRVHMPGYHVQGTGEPNMTVTVNGDPAEVAEDGTFGADVVLREGSNKIRIIATDSRGNQADVTRVVTYEP